jgi:hypothetical protein
MLKTMILIPILSFAAAAQTPPQTSTRSSAAKWEGLKTLTSGIEVRVATANAKPVQGALESVTDSALVLKQAGGPVSFDRAQIRSVSVKGKEHRLRNSMIGLGVGTALGVAIGYGVGHAGCRNGDGWCDLGTAVDTAIGGVSGLVGGTLAGVFWHTGGWQKIYAP